jgi:hypothetical protein
MDASSPPLDYSTSETLKPMDPAAKCRSTDSDLNFTIANETKSDKRDLLCQEMVDGDLFNIAKN